MNSKEVRRAVTGLAAFGLLAVSPEAAGQQLQSRDTRVIAEEAPHIDRQPISPEVMPAFDIILGDSIPVDSRYTQPYTDGGSGFGASFYVMNHGRRELFDLRLDPNADGNNTPELIVRICDDPNPEERHLNALQCPDQGTNMVEYDDLGANGSAETITMTRATPNLVGDTAVSLSPASHEWNETADQRAYRNVLGTIGNYPLSRGIGRM
jgi:hypothetical protein